MMRSLFVLTVLFSWCVSLVPLAAQQDNWSKTPSGLKYKFFNKQEGQPSPKVSDMVTVSGFYQADDTIFFDSRKSPTPYIFPVNESVYPGDIFEGIRLMSAGDSAVFLLSADSLFLRSFRVKEMPKYIRPGSEVKFFVKLLRFQPKDEFEKEMQAKFEEDARKADLLKAKEDSLIRDYLEKHNYKADKSNSGLYYVEQQKGTGPKAEPGKTVKVHYTGRLLDGTVFDSSVSRGEPFSFPLGKNKVIRGWEEGIAKMNVGGKGILLIPSKLGYGGSNMGKIPPHSILVFEVELLGVN